MSLFKFIKMIGFFTILALIYIHMQMRIIALAYDAKKKEQEVVSISERNGALAYEILSLKSASNLGEKVLGNQTRMKFCDNQNVVQLVTAKSSLLQGHPQIADKSAKVNGLFALFAKSGSVANAAERPEDVLKPWRRER